MTPGASLAPRTDFPQTAQQTYLNAAGMGLVPLPVQRRFLDLATRIGTAGTDVFFDSYDEIMIAPRRSAARLFGAALADVAIINSVSEVVSQIAAWRRPGRRENVVLLDIDHPSTSFPWLRMAQDTGCEVRFARVAGAPETLELDHIARLIDERTAVVSVSHVQWTTGHRFDLAALADLAHARDALLVIDATHSAGVVPFDAPACGADVIATGSFKWLCAYSGTGACYVRPGLSDVIRPVMVGSRTLHQEARPEGAPVSEFSLPSGAARLEYGSSAHVLRVAFAASMDYLLDIGITRIFEHVQALAARLTEGLAARGARILTPKNGASRAGIVTAMFPGHDSAELVERLALARVAVMLRMGAIRFAPHFYNDEGDIERALAGVDQALQSAAARRSVS